MKYLLFSPLVPSKEEKNILVLLSLCVFTFQFLNDRVDNYVKKHNCEPIKTSQSLLDSKDGSKFDPDQTFWQGVYEMK